MNAPVNNIFVTGGAGFIGSEFVRFAANNDTVGKIFVIDKLTYAADLSKIQPYINSGKVIFLKEDVINSHLFKKEILSSSFLIHFAAETHVDRSIDNGIPFIHTNVNGIYSLLEAAKVNKNLKILIVSTDEVYGSIITGEVDEKTPLNPSSTYSASKASADLISIAFMRTFGQRITITRCCNNYGISQNPEKFIPNMINAILNGKNITLYGDGLHVREWIHVEDHVKALWTLLIEGNVGEIYNIGTGQRFTNLEVANAVIESFEVSSDRISFIEDRKGHDFRYSLNSEKIKSNFSWRPKNEFFASLRKLIDQSKKLG